MINPDQLNVLKAEAFDEILDALRQCKVDELPDNLFLLREKYTAWVKE